jgi:hypothetical protein
MKTRSQPVLLSIMCLAGLPVVHAQQANFHLDYNPQKNTENLIPFGATLNSPDVHDARTVTFRVKAPWSWRMVLAWIVGLHGHYPPHTIGNSERWNHSE